MRSIACAGDCVTRGHQHLDHGRRDGHASRLHRIERGGANGSRTEPVLWICVRLPRGKRGDLIKLLWWDGDGLCLFAKRLERGRFVWPQAETAPFV